MSEIVRLVDVYKAYRLGGRWLVVLRGVNLSVERGETVAVLGKSGSGKTTLLNVVAGLDRPSYGHVYVDGADLVMLDEDELARFRRERVGFIFQQYNLIPELTALENVMLAQRARFGRADRASAVRLLEMVGLADRADHRPSELSGGQQQRVAIAMALAKRPRLLLADEPTGALDSRSGEVVLRLLLDLVERFETTLILVTHDPDVAVRMGRIVRIVDGRVLEGPDPSAPLRASSRGEELEGPALLGLSAWGEGRGPETRA